MFKKYRFHIGLTLLVQSASFVVLFFMLYSKKKSLANTFLALSAIGGIAGAYLVLKEAKSEVEACEQAAKDAEREAELILDEDEAVEMPDSAAVEEEIELLEIEVDGEEDDI